MRGGQYDGAAKSGDEARIPWRLPKARQGAAGILRLVAACVKRSREIFNNPSTQVRFTSTDVITYDLTPAGAGWRVDFTVVGTSGDDEGVILTGYAIDGGPAGSGADSVSVTVRTATGTVLFTGTGTVSEGDVVIVR